MLTAVLLSSRKVLLEDPRGLICKSLSLDFKLLENLRGLHAFLKQSLCENFQWHSCIRTILLSNGV